MHRIKPTPLPDAERYAVSFSAGDPHVPDGWPSEMVHLITIEETPEVAGVREEMHPKLASVYDEPAIIAKFREMTGAEVNELRDSLMDKWQACLDRKDADELERAKRDATEDLAHPDRFHIADQTRKAFTKAIGDAKNAADVEVLRAKIARL